MHLALVAQSALTKLGFDQEADLERCRRTLVGHARDRDNDLAPAEGVKGFAQLLRCCGAVEVMRLRVEVFDELGQDARAGCQNELVVAQRLATGQQHALVLFVHLDDLVDDELDARVE